MIEARPGFLVIELKWLDKYTLSLFWLVHTAFRFGNHFWNWTDSKWWFRRTILMKRVLLPILHVDAWNVFAFRASPFLIQVNNVMKRRVRILHTLSKYVSSVRINTRSGSGSCILKASHRLRKTTKNKHTESDRHSLTRTAHSHAQHFVLLLN